MGQHQGMLWGKPRENYAVKPGTVMGQVIGPSQGKLRGNAREVMGPRGSYGAKLGKGMEQRLDNLCGKARESYGAKPGKVMGQSQGQLWDLGKVMGQSLGKLWDKACERYEAKSGKVNGQS